MSNYPSLPEEESAALDPVKAKTQRAQDAEKIRQDFIKSQRLPVKPATGQQPSPESTEDDY